MDTETQLAKIIFKHCMENMKFALDMEERRYEDGRNNHKFKFYKKTLMWNTYQSIRELFLNLSDLGLIKETDYEEDVKDGQKETPSGGSGYLNTKEIDNLISKKKK